MPRKRYNVEFERTYSETVQVEAGDEEEAKRLAYERVTWIDPMDAHEDSGWRLLRSYEANEREKT